MQELVVESLVVSLAMVVFYVLVDETTQMPLAERDHACETLLFDRPDEPLGIGVEIGTLRRQPNRLNTGALQDLAKDPRIEGVAVVNQRARPAQTAIDRVGQIAGLLLHPRAARLRVDPGDGHAAGSQLDHEEDEVPPEPRQRQHLDGEQIAGRQALPVRLQERLPGHVSAPLGRRVDSVVVQDPLHRGPGDSVAEVRERAADPRVAPPRIVDRHPDHELGDVLSGHWSTSTSAGAAIVFLGDQSPVPTQDRIRGDDARDLRQDPPAEFVTAHSESTTLGVRQAKRPRAQVFSEDPILLPEIVDQIVLVTVHPASEREDEELQRRRHSLRLLGRLDQHRPSLGRFFAPYGEDHGSRAELARRIQMQIALDIGSATRRDLREARERSKVLNEQITSNRERQESLRFEIAALASEKTRLDLQIGQAEAFAQTLDVKLDAAKPSPEEQLRSVETQRQADVEHLESQMRAARLATESKRVSLETAKVSVDAAVAEIAQREVVIASLEVRVRAFRSDPRLTTYSLDVDPEQLEQRMRERSREIAECKTEAAEADIELARIRLESSGHQQKSTALKARLKSLTGRAATLQNTITQITTRLEEAKLKPNISQDELLAVIADEERTQAQLLSLQDSTSNLELAIDAATTSAAFTQIAQNVRGKERTLADATRRRDQHQPWVEYFEDVAKLTSM